ncbi:hypothetical protein KUTeg_004022 [Tegillarca granosa]|uniref:Uncharacterized protein n=1 Tax=Tegillarca granosa TaxID=220873 RepID=A0ABQ9FQE3_TEGGR|nr:hypothetical protein KUTeg_004022 [Tegillarca granosa]
MMSSLLQYNFANAIGLLMRYDVNVSAVWVSKVTGNGASQLNEIMATIVSPGKTQPIFTNIGGMT